MKTNQIRPSSAPPRSDTLYLHENPQEFWRGYRVKRLQQAACVYSISAGGWLGCVSALALSASPLISPQLTTFIGVIGASVGVTACMGGAFAIDSAKQLTPQKVPYIRPNSPKNVVREIVVAEQPRSAPPQRLSNIARQPNFHQHRFSWSH